MAAEGIYYNPGRLAGSPPIADAAEWAAYATRDSSARPGKPGRPLRDDGLGAPEPTPAAGAGMGLADRSYHASRLFSDWAGTLAGDWLREQVLVQDREASLYLVRTRAAVPSALRHGPWVPAEASFVGVMAGIAVGEGEPLRLAEQVDPALVARMVPVMKAFAYDVAPVWAVYSVNGAADGARKLQALVEEVTASPATLRLGGDGDDSVHELWRLQPGQSAAFAGLLGDRALVVAGGAVQVAALSALAPQHAGLSPGTGQGGPSSVLALLTAVDGAPGTGPVLLPVHRLLLAGRGLSYDVVAQRLAAYFRLLEPRAPATGPVLERLDAALEELAGVRGEFNGFLLYGGQGRLHIVRSKGRMLMENWTHPMGGPAWRSMDVNILHALALERALGIPPETSRLHREPVAVEPSAERAVERVDSGEAAVAFLVPPPGPDQVLQAALHNNPLPADALRPWPPVPAGLLIRRRRTGA
ncbi:DUF1015 family protein [Carboxydochorda subterranea]|uniref:DUF1015 family protein n=1 Tax=Carboxydichorda subterranea TaxID=3109565 RepID=A0ABZ1BYH7_9FIRM|nr:DUF1015 family protein [Limnochorda sp. L945t]WRP17643.1 DUF1015 family protein [Limnochorda sp. L945t]